LFTRLKEILSFIVIIAYVECNDLIGWECWARGGHRTGTCTTMV